jgi:hypothetical protein
MPLMPAKWWKQFTKVRPLSVTWRFDGYVSRGEDRGSYDTIEDKMCGISGP